MGTIGASPAGNADVILVVVGISGSKAHAPSSRDAHPCLSLQWSILFHCSPPGGDVPLFCTEGV